MHSDWLLKLRISFAIHFRETRLRFVPKNVVLVAELMNLNLLFALY